MFLVQKTSYIFSYKIKDYSINAENLQKKSRIFYKRKFGITYAM